MIARWLIVITIVVLSPVVVPSLAPPPVVVETQTNVIRLISGDIGTGVRTKHGILTANHVVKLNKANVKYAVIRRSRSYDLALLDGATDGYDIAPGVDGPAKIIGYPSNKYVERDVTITTEGHRWRIDSPSGGLSRGMSGGAIIQNGLLVGIVQKRKSSDNTGYGANGLLINRFLKGELP